MPASSVIDLSGLEKLEDPQLGEFPDWDDTTDLHRSMEKLNGKVQCLFCGYSSSSWRAISFHSTQRCVVGMASKRKRAESWQAAQDNAAVAQKIKRVAENAIEPSELQRPYVVIEPLDMSCLKSSFGHAMSETEPTPPQHKAPPQRTAHRIKSKTTTTPDKEQAQMMVGSIVRMPFSCRIREVLVDFLMIETAPGEIHKFSLKQVNEFCNHKIDATQARIGTRITMWWHGKVTGVSNGYCTVQFDDGSYVEATTSVVTRHLNKHNVAHEEPTATDDECSICLMDLVNRLAAASGRYDCCWFMFC